MPSLKFRILLIIQLAFAINAFAQLNTSVYINEARADMNSGKYFDAIQKLDICIEVKPGECEAYFFRGVCKYFLNDDIGAEQDLNVAVSMYDPYLSDAYRYRSSVKYRLGDYEGAMRDVNQLIAIQGNDSRLYTERAFDKLANQDYIGAISDCNKALRMPWSGETIYLCKGMAFNALAQYDSALVSYNKALKINPKSTDAIVRIGITNAAMGAYHDAIRQYDHALELDSTNTLAYFSRAEAEIKLNSTDSAFEDLNMVIKYDPMNALAYFNRGVMEINKNKYSDALADLDKVLVLNPKNIQALLNRAKLKSALNDYHGAIADYDKIIELFPYLVETYYDRGRLKEALHDEAGAKADYNTGKIMADVSHYQNNSQRLSDSAAFTHLMQFNSDFSSGAQKIPDTVSVNLLPLFRIVNKDNNSGKAGYLPVVFKKSKQEYSNFYLTDQKPENSLNDSIQLGTNEVQDTGSNIKTILKNAIQETNMQLFSYAIKNYDRAIEQDPECEIAYFARSVNLCKEADMLNRFNSGAQYTTVNKTYRVANDPNNEKYQSALADFNKVIQMEPDFAYAYYNRAYVKYKMLDFSGALADYNKAIQIDPDFSDAYYNRGLVFFCQKDKLSACQDFSKAGELGQTEAYLLIKLYCSQVLR
ncbi:MAG TPA: tetratricopeptide repeat protein [Bacteroidia bacterium]|jgi:tetratricopeptide (TPR) repeat protein|nr:tetratricopeptide repeat protein [Bacteroidia bacterium]